MKNTFNEGSRGEGYRDVEQDHGTIGAGSSDISTETVISSESKGM